MFTNWGDPQTFWLNVTNAALGAIMLVCIVAIGVAVAKELTARRRDTGQLVGAPRLGEVLSDGGEPYVEEEDAEDRS
jgi:hypothetical protein